MRSIFRLLLILMAVSAPVQAFGAQYFLSPTGSDSNNGTSVSTPWLSPNHAVNCGDTITAAAGNYNAANFYQGQWGTVTCSAGGVAWLQCATFDGCKIAATSSQAMFVSSSFWGVSGWEASDTWSFGNCFYTQTESGQSVHHVIFANDIANGCTGGGFVAYNSGGAASDYYAYVGDIAYNTGTASGVCASGFSMGFLKQLDANSGTHLYVADTYAWGNVNPPAPGGCAGTAPTDGEGLIYDTLNSTGFTGQVAAENNIYVFNDGRGIEINNNSAAHAIFDHNTLYGNNQQAGQAFPNNNGELYVNEAGNVTATANLAMTNQATTSGDPIFAASITGTGSLITITSNWFYSAAGNTTSGPSGDYSSNTTGTNPSFTSPTLPPAPSCTGTANVTACVATIISNYHPNATGASAFGYQPVSPTSVTNSAFPQWLCNGTALIAGFPSGIATPGCGAGSSPTLSSIAVTGSNTVNSGSTDQLVATGTYSDGSHQTLTSTSTWASSLTSICTVGASTGLVTGVAAGNCTITATNSGITSPGFVVTVSLTLSSIAITGNNSLIAGGPTSQLTATGTYSNNSTANITSASTWSSNTPSVCTVVGGLVTPVAAGSCSITAADAGKVSPAFVVTVASATITSIALSGNNALTVGQGTSQLTATGTFSNGTNSNVTSASTWNSSNTSVCTVVGGLVTPVAGGTCVITATDSGVTNTPTFTVTVTASAPPGKSTLTNIQISGNVQFH